MLFKIVKSLKIIPTFFPLDKKCGLLSLVPNPVTRKSSFSEMEQLSF
ncbi:hypothetical protein PORCRE_2115 [Porphyromonas crevioricanis JCM 15906]|uniref:Uncharacterized protein n=1 Tax=Porphyromonas crevioricanis JCM 15906 TaxID=1305617 RepID=T1CRA6_9PORP|nr:hypothetical protein PORCRE_2115 [Porphyromonas crevioricanis JCM 15906]